MALLGQEAGRNTSQLRRLPDYQGVATSFLQWVNVPPYEWIGGQINPNKALYGEGSSMPLSV